METLSRPLSDPNKRNYGCFPIQCRSNPLNLARESTGRVTMSAWEVRNVKTPSQTVLSTCFYLCPRYPARGSLCRCFLRYDHRDTHRSAFDFQGKPGFCASRNGGNRSTTGNKLSDLEILYDYFFLNVFLLFFLFPFLRTMWFGENICTSLSMFSNLAYVPMDSSVRLYTWEFRYDIFVRLDVLFVIRHSIVSLAMELPNSLKPIFL